MRTPSIWLAGMTLAFFLSGCAATGVTVTKAPGMELAGRYKFRMNNDVHDPEGKKITDEIMQTDLDRWYQFMELVGAVRASFEDRGYQWVTDPTEPADFVVDVCFTSFYSENVSDERMQAQKPATFLVGRKDGDRYRHMMIIAVLARDPQLSSNEYVTIWEGRKMVTSSQRDARVWALPLIASIVSEFPRAEPREL